MDRAQIEKISKALGDETRLRIYAAIASHNDMTCGAIVELEGITPATVTHHLKILNDAGLIVCRKSGQFVHSCVVPETIADYARALAAMAPTGKRPRRAAGRS